MSENRDPGIKLFGATIQVQGNEGENLVEEVADRGADDEGGEDEQKENLELDATVSKDKDQEDAVSDEQAETPTSSCKEDLSKDLVKEKENLNEEKHSKLEGEQLENNPPQEKTLKKPDKILPCPRCNSKDTKFCYYNNYNVNQPRHFCKNCQRYWTNGGTMRNVPVGAGRRKNKSTSHYRQIMPTESTQTVQSENSSLKSSGTVLSFGSDSPLCESLASVLITDKGIRNGFHQVEDQRIQVLRVGENGEEQSNGSSITASNSTEEGNGTNLSEPMSRNCNAMPPIPCFTAAPWPYPWNLAQLSSAFPPPAFCAANFPVPFYPPAPYWGCPMPSAWTIPWPVQPPSSSPKPKFPGSNPNSPTLGKHPRDGTPANTIDPEKEESIKENGSERSLWIPKTLRIDDPGEAAKSSIWATLGIKNDKTDTSPGSMFKAFQPKMQQKKNHSPETSPVLQANPAAMSRSINFHENS